MKSWFFAILFYMRIDFNPQILYNFPPSAPNHPKNSVKPEWIRFFNIDYNSKTSARSSLTDSIVSNQKSFLSSISTHKITQKTQ
jgi:hypothetical protein